MKIEVENEDIQAEADARRIADAESVGMTIIPAVEPDIDDILTREQYEVAFHLYEAQQPDSDPSPPQPQTSADAGSSTATKTVEIKIALPGVPKFIRFRRNSFSLFPLSFRRLLVFCAVGATAVAVVNGPFRLPWQKSSKNIAAVSSESIIDSTPDHPTLLPADKGVEELGGWKRISPPNTNPVHTYADRIGGVRINVSEQPLPKDFKDNAATRIDDLAKSFNASEKVTIGETTLYIGTSAEGPQSVIFTKKDLLILMKSTTTIPSAQWAEYVSTLQ